MPVNLTVDTGGLEKSLGGFIDQLPFILQRSINDTVVEAQSAIAGHARDVFTIRRDAFLKRSMKVTQFAKRDNLAAVLEVADVGGRSTGDIFGKFESGGVKRAHRGRTVAVPTQYVQPNQSRIVTASKRPRNLKNSWKGQTKSGKPVIFQRRGRGKRESVRVAYVLKSAVRIDSRLQFGRVTGRTASERFTINTDKWVVKALETAKLR